MISVPFAWVQFHTTICSTTNARSRHLDLDITMFLGSLYIEGIPDKCVINCCFIFSSSLR